MDIREAEVVRIITLLETGTSQTNVASTCEVSRSTVQYVYNRYLETVGYIRRTWLVAEGRQR
ncbi:jg18533, partial [Pararge aegeria aegeria]